METLEAILSRRSIRKYTGEKVSDELIDKALHAAMAAPSAGNEQPWHFIVIRDRATIEKITHIHQHSSMLIDASGAILVCADLKLQKYEGYWMQDCAAATQNILLYFHSIGIGAVWLGVFPETEHFNGVKEIFAFNENIAPVSIVSFGYPKEVKSSANCYDKNRIHYEKW